MQSDCAVFSRTFLPGYFPPFYRYITQMEVPNMVGFLRKLHRLWICRQDSLLLAFFCVTGALTGICIADRSGEHFFSMMRMAPSVHVSITGLIASAVLPFLIAAFAVYISAPQILYSILFLKIMLFCWCGCGIYAVFGSAGWLVRMLLQFTDCCMVPVLCWFCLRHSSGSHVFLWRDFSVCIAIAGIIGIIDYSVISPFLATL